MKIHEKYINRCLELAKNGRAMAQPNPSVGCVIVVDDTIIGEGYTSAYGGPHAEVNAIQSVRDPGLLEKATLYVSLEPCNHFGKTPPCTNLIIESGIKRIVIGCVDPNEKVSGKGVQKLKDHGCSVITGVLEKECIASHRRFFTYQTKKRPYIILKWAESKDGFIDVNRSITSDKQAKPNWITTQYSRQLVHKWRSEEAAILVGTNTVLNDNPSLTVRDWSGSNPVRIVLDRELKIPSSYRVHNNQVKTIFFTAKQASNSENICYETITFDDTLVEQIVDRLYQHQLTSVIIEGGSRTLQTFIAANLWDEARIFTGSVNFSEGITAPVLQGVKVETYDLGRDLLKILRPNH